MNRIRPVSAAIILLLTFIACGNKSNQAGTFEKDQPVKERVDSATTSSNVQTDNNVIEEHKPSSVCSSSSSSSRSHKHRYDNMRGFDPASEDDMEDNGMSRYMENNDEEGWD